MIANKRFWLACATALMIAGHTMVAPASAQPASPAAIATAKELVELKGGANMFDPIIAGVVDQAKTLLLRTSPQLSKDLNEVAATLVTEFQPRRAELINEAAKIYAGRFSEQELKEMVAFYKTPLGRKMLVQEPLVLDETFNYVQQWGPRAAEDVMNRFRAEMRKKGHQL
jgi:hypothetical protein